MHMYINVDECVHWLTSIRSFLHNSHRTRCWGVTQTRKGQHPHLQITYKLITSQRNKCYVNVI